MRRLWSWLAVLGLLAFIVGQAPMVAVAQTAATPTSGSQPPLFSVPGVSAPILASGQVDSLTNPDRLRLERLTLPAGATTAHATAGPELIAVESGAVTITDTFGFAATLEAGQGTMVATSSTYQLANRTTADTQVLRLSVASGHDTAAVASPVAGTPIASPVATTPILVSVLLDQPIKDFPSGSVQLFLAVGTWQPGASSGRVEHSGPLGVVVDTGTLTITSPTGIKGQFAAGKGAVLPTSTPLEATNSTTQPATAVLIGVSSAYGSLVNATAPTPTPSPVPTETPVPTTTPVPTPTTAPSPTATSTPMPVAGAALYQANTSGGLDAWSGSGDWKHISGMLVNDGSGAYSLINSPYQPTGVDYAVEAEIQLVRPSPNTCNSSFGVVARQDDNGGYWGGVLVDCNGQINQARITDAGPNNHFDSQALTQKDFKLDNGWHRYRIEVQGNNVRLLIDGALVMETTDNSHLSAGMVGLWSDRAEVNVRSFKVIAL